jgi:hypothetical protein
MPTLGALALTLLDWSKRLGPDGNVPMIAELLNQTNEVLEDMLWIEGNLPTGHRSTIRTGLPSATWRKLYGGVQPSKSTTAQIDDATAMLEARGSVDLKLANLNGNSNAFRLSESIAFLEAMNQAFVTALFAGDTTLNPEQFHGLRLRYPSLSGATAQNVLTGGGSTALTEVWLVGWGAQTIAGIFPKGSSAGLTHQDLGEQDDFDGASPAGRYRALMDRYTWDCGLMVKDWRYAVRIPNIDTAALIAQTGTQALTAGTALLSLMSDALERLPSKGMSRPVFYCNRLVRANLRKIGMNKSNAAMGIEAAAGQIQTSFMGIPIKIVDYISNNVTAVA